MNILVENEAKGELDFDYEEIIKQVVEKIVSTENCPYDIEVNVLLTNNEEIHETNYNFRNIDRPTDVLSFPMVDYDYPADFSFRRYYRTALLVEGIRYLQNQHGRKLHFHYA